jgi:hypothetical protein
MTANWRLEIQPHSFQTTALDGDTATFIPNHSSGWRYSHIHSKPQHWMEIQPHSFQTTALDGDTATFIPNHNTGWRYSHIHSKPQQWMEVSDQLHSSTTLPRGKKPPVPTELEAGSVPEPIRTLYIDILIMIYLLTAIGLSPGGSTHLHTNNT